MDRIKEVQEDPAKRKQALKSMLCSDSLHLAVCIAMVVVGVQYKDECTFDVPQYLMVGGGITLALTLLKVIAILTPSECDDKFVAFLTPMALFANMCVTLWGSIIVFGHYSVVSYENVHLPTGRPDFPDGNRVSPGTVEDMINETNHYCAYTPYMFAYVILIMQWIVLPILLCCSCTIVWTIVCGAMCCGSSAGSSTVYSAAATKEPQSSAWNPD